MSIRIKVFFADDSSVVRRLLGDVLQADPRIDVVGMAKNGAEAIGEFARAKPDVVLLDVEMPVMDGVDAAGVIRSMDAQIPIIMFSSITTRGGEATLDALANGANDYVTKPMGTGHVSEAIKHIQEILIPKIIDWGTRYQMALENPMNPAVSANATASAGAKPGAPTARTVAPAAKPLGSTPPGSDSNAMSNRTGSRRPPLIVAIGVSTGGPDALSDFVRMLPSNFSLPIVIAQHMPPVFTQLLANRLNQACNLDVKEAIDGHELTPGTIWIAPGGRHLAVARQGVSYRMSLNDGPAENSCRPSADVLFRSVAEAYGSNSLAIVMTGMGKDGLAGAKAINAAGGTILAQDQVSSVVWGMPGAVANAGLADQLLPPSELAEEVLRRTGASPLAPVEAGA